MSMMRFSRRLTDAPLSRSSINAEAKKRRNGVQNEIRTKSLLGSEHSPSSLVVFNKKEIGSRH